MRTETTKRSGTLVSSAVLAAVCCGTIASPAMADPPTDIDILVEQIEDTTGNSYLWDFIDGLHSFGSTENFDSGAVPGSGYEVEVSSGISGPTSYYLIMDWTAFDLPYGIGSGNSYDVLMFNLDLDPTPERDGDDGAIDSVSVTMSIGGSDMTSVQDLLLVDNIVTFSMDAQEVVDNSNVVVIEWTTKAVPAPGALALLGMAGFAGARRRRRS